jgi:hypothetical protein
VGTFVLAGAARPDFSHNNSTAARDMSAIG